MPKLKKASRGKHRWIGSRISGVFSRRQLKHFLNEHIDGVDWKLFDLKNSDEKSFFILKVPLSDYAGAIERLNSTGAISTLSSSGKIRLLRERLSTFMATE